MKSRFTEAAKVLATSADRIWSGVWWWQLLLNLELRRLDRILSLQGETAFATLKATERVRYLTLAVTYLRPVTPALRQALQQAKQHGVGLQDLRILNLNRDLVASSESPAMVRRALWMPVMAYVAAFLAVAGQLMLTVQVVALRGPMVAKCVAIVCIAAVQMFLWRGWSLYTTRAWQVVVRCGPRIDALRIECASASIRDFPPARQPHSKT